MANNLLSVWGTIGSVLLAILILLVMITIHEFGHYVAGKIFKFRINEFSIGFGPALFKRKNRRTGELFSVRLIPLGGYCAFAGEDGQEEEETKEDQPMPESEGSNTPSDGEAAAAAPAPKADDGLFTHKKPWQRIIVLIAGAFMNYLLALLLIFILFGVYGQSLVMVRGVAEPTEEYTAEQSFREGDILLKADGKTLYLTTDISLTLNGKKEGDEVVFRVARLQEDGTRKAVDVPIRLRGSVAVKNSNDFTGVWNALGVGIETREDGAKYYMVDSVGYHFGFFETIGRSFVYSFKIAGTIFRVIGELFTGRLGLSSLGGPITTISTTSRVVSAGGMSGFLEIAALIGVNLAVFNLLPIPALDGSKVVFTIIEWIRGKPINRKVEAIIHAVGIVLLFGFAILVDILQFV